MIDKQPQHARNVEGAAPYAPHRGATEAVLYGRGALHAVPNSEGAVLRVSDTPYTPPTLPYAQRPTCRGTRRDGAPCKAKSRDGGTCCEAHLEQE